MLSVQHVFRVSAWETASLMSPERKEFMNIECPFFFKEEEKQVNGICDICLLVFNKVAICVLIILQELALRF